MIPSRRNVLKAGAGALALAAVPANVIMGADMEKKKIPIGLQVYSVRNEAAKDLPGVLKQIAEMGYQGVEFAGYYGRKAAELKKMLDDNGLKCCGTHTGYNTVVGDALKATIEFNQTIGNKYLIVPGMGKEQLGTKEAILKTAAVFAGIAEKLKPLGMYVGYHAHGGDFRKIDGETVWDIFFSNTPKEVVMQMDVGNCLGGGGDPYATLRKFPGRSLTIHIKEHGGRPGAPVGEGTVRWNEIFEICETTGGTEWYIVEHESDPKTPMDSVRKCLENLRKMGK